MPNNQFMKNGINDDLRNQVLGILKSGGGKLKATKYIVDSAGISLKEAKDYVDNIPKDIYAKKAEDISDKLERFSEKSNQIAKNSFKLGCSLIFLVFLVIIIVAIFSGGDEKKEDINNVDNNATAMSKNNENHTDSVVLPKLNEIVVTGNFRFTATKTVYKKRTSDGTLVLLVYLTYENISSSQLTLDCKYFELINEYGTTYAASNDLNLDLSEGGNGIYFEECNPNIIKKGVIAFEVPKQGHYYIIVSDGVEAEVVDLN